MSHRRAAQLTARTGPRREREEREREGTTGAVRERDWTLGGQEPETHGAQSRAPGKTPSNTQGEKLERNMVRRLSGRHAEMIVGVCQGSVGM